MKTSLSPFFAALLVAQLSAAQEPSASTPAAPSTESSAAAGPGDDLRSNADAPPNTPAPGAASEASAASSVGSPPSPLKAAELARASSDLEELKLERAVEAGNTRRIEIYGFADFTYERTLVSDKNPWKRVVPWRNSFAIGNFNVYMSNQLSDTWRTLSEVRFMYLPNGSEKQNADGSFTATDTSVMDNTTFGEPIHWGGIHIERVWVEHTFDPLITVRVGQFLTPYGIWNVDHGSPTVIGVRKPFVVQGDMFPRSQVGIEVYGSRFFGPAQVGYHLTLSNGRTPIEYVDFSDDKAFGGRLYVNTDALGTLTVGASFYRGNYYDRSRRFSIRNDADGPVLATTFETKSKNREFAVGADVRWQLGEFLFQGEILMNDVAFAENARPRVVQAGATGFLPDYRRWGLYALIGYRTPILGTMPYFVFQHAQKPDDLYMPPPTGFNLGLNIRPIPDVVLKVDYSYATWGKPDRLGLGRYPIHQLGTQVAWAF